MFRTYSCNIPYTHLLTVVTALASVIVSLAMQYKYIVSDECTGFARTTSLFSYTFGPLGSWIVCCLNMKIELRSCSKGAVSDVICNYHWFSTVSIKSRLLFTPCRICFLRIYPFSQIAFYINCTYCISANIFDKHFNMHFTLLKRSNIKSVAMLRRCI